MSVIFAPSIMFQNILVCSQALEINCVNDLHMKATLNDLSLINNLGNDFRSIFAKSTTTVPTLKRKSISKRLSADYLYRRSQIGKPKSHVQTMALGSEHSENDSGFKSNSKKNQAITEGCSHTGNGNEPFILSFVGGLFGIKLYKSMVRKRIAYLSLFCIW